MNIPTLEGKEKKSFLEHKNIKNSKGLSEEVKLIRLLALLSVTDILRFNF